jgi:hypothetical protein
MHFQTTISVYILVRTIAFRKKKHWNGFFYFKKFFFPLEVSKIIVFANFVEKTIRTPCNRAKILAAGVWD